LVTIFFLHGELFALVCHRHYGGGVGAALAGGLAAAIHNPLSFAYRFIFFGWMAMCGSCLFLAEGILARSGHDMLTQRKLWWQLPLLSSAIAVVRDLYR
jgi:hypothetical protein